MMKNVLWHLDFGGGTTDFDFGIWSSGDEDDDNHDYNISRFGEGEDPYLGGENILGVLAYNVFWTIMMN